MILEFDNGAYRLFDIRNIPSQPKSLIADIQSDRHLFLSAALDSVAATVRWANNVDFDFQKLYEESVDLEDLTNIRDYTKTILDTPVTEAVIQLKESVRANIDLIDNYKYFLKHDTGDEEEKEDVKKSISKLKNEMPSYQRAIEILEAHQKENGDKKEMKERLLDIYRKGTTEEFYGMLPFPQNFYWRFISVIGAFELGRVSNELLKRGYSKDVLALLFPAEDIELMIQHFERYGSIEIEQVFEALAEIYKEKERIGILERAAKKEPVLLDVMSEFIKFNFPNSNEIESEDNYE
ncbi:hypothetical protein [Niallia sp.]|uniref:hypothetical protein n=1 Tax=Niallia sp. TaxID=2837523 RepID=UPI00289E3611|nr:hypothetical protein [Niallia sp.]